MPKAAFIYSEKFSAVSYGQDHPMRPQRLKLTFDLIKECGLFNIPSVQIIEARKAEMDELVLFHTPEYLNILKEADSGIVSPKGIAYGIGYGDNPAFKGVFEWSLYSTGATLQAAELVADKKADIAFNIAGGLHHAMKNRASGFCYINDACVGIMSLLKRNIRVAYVDIDAHHGDGVERAFYDTDKVLTISIHESGEYLFPGTGFPKDMGIGKGRGYSVNLPLPPSSGDRLFLKGFKAIVPPFIDAFKPDILVTQLGVDTFASDPITHLNLSINGFMEAIKIFRSFNLPWVALGGGGYNMDTVRRAWTIAWAIMNKVEPPKGLMDEPNPLFEKVPRDSNGNLKKIVGRDADFLKRKVLPLVTHSSPKPSPRRMGRGRGSVR